MLSWWCLNAGGGLHLCLHRPDHVPRLLLAHLPPQEERVSPSLCLTQLRHDAGWADWAVSEPVAAKLRSITVDWGPNQ